MSTGSTPVPSSRLASVRGPMPASMSNTPAGVRRIAAFPAEPLARMQSSGDIGLFGILREEGVALCEHLHDIRVVRAKLNYEREVR